MPGSLGEGLDPQVELDLVERQPGPLVSPVTFQGESCGSGPRTLLGLGFRARGGTSVSGRPKGTAGRLDLGAPGRAVNSSHE